MFARNLLKRSLVAGVAIGAAGLPAAAQARFIEGAGAPAAPPAHAVNAASAQQQFARPHAHVQQRSAVAGGRSVASPVRSTASSQAGFQWGDAGIGAAGTVLLLGASAGAAGTMRRRRTHRPVTG